MTFEQVVDRLPELAGAFHGDMGDLLARQPVGHRQDICRHGAKGPLLDRFRTLRAWRDTADNDALLMHIQTGTVRVDDVHTASPS